MYVSFEDVMTYLTEAVNERGEDYVNFPQDTEWGTSCVYKEEDGSPSCAVGYVLHRAGFDLGQLSADENVMGFRELYQTFRGAGKLFMHTKTQDMLGTFQTMQDNEMPWGTTLAHVKSVYSAPDNDVMPKEVF